MRYGFQRLLMIWIKKKIRRRRDDIMLQAQFWYDSIHHDTQYREKWSGKKKAEKFIVKSKSMSQSTKISFAIVIEYITNEISNKMKKREISRVYAVCMYNANVLSFVHLEFTCSSICETLIWFCFRFIISIWILYV